MRLLSFLFPPFLAIGVSFMQSYFWKLFCSVRTCVRIPILLTQLTPSTLVPDSLFTVHATIHIIDSDGMGAPFCGRSNFDFWRRLSQ